MQKPPVPARQITCIRGRTSYPEPFAKRVAGRCKRKLGEHFMLRNFGVNLTSLEPGAISALAHHHSHQDEFVYVLEGTACLVLGEEEHQMQAGDCIGLPAGSGVAHQLINRSDKTVVYLEIGDRMKGDEVEYPFEDIKGSFQADDCWTFTRKDGAPFLQE